MEHHGFGRKTFNIETDANGTPVVHRLNGKFNENYYNKHDQKNPEEQIWQEIVEHFDDFQHVYFIAIDVSAEVLGRGGGACGLGGAHYFTTFHDAYGFVPFAPGGLALRHRDFTEGEEVLGGSAVIPASGPCFEDNQGFLHPLRATTHELAHAFGLGHDFSDPDSAVEAEASDSLSVKRSGCLSVVSLIPVQYLPTRPGKLNCLLCRLITRM